MRVYTFGENRYYESPHFFNEKCQIGELERFVNVLIKEFTKRSLFKELLELYGQRYNLQGYIILHAHSAKRGRRWMFANGGRGRIMQNWIDQMDGQALAIFLGCCNPKNRDISSKISVIIHPNDSINMMDLTRGGNLRIYVPGEGYLENNYYRLKKSIDKLK